MMSGNVREAKATLRVILEGLIVGERAEPVAALPDARGIRSQGLSDQRAAYSSGVVEPILAGRLLADLE